MPRSFIPGAALLVGLALSAPQSTPRRQRVVKLRTPGPQRVLLRGGVMTIGSTIVDVATAQAMCREEPLKSACNTRMFADEIDAHTVKLHDYWLDRTEVTVMAYRRCVKVGVCEAPGSGAAQSWNAKPKHPITLVNWYDARRYCQWAGGRLPTEAEWERAARGWSLRRYPWGEVYNKKLSNHGRFAPYPLDEVDGFAEQAPVGSFPAGRTREGIVDLAGNVEEWVADWYDTSYPPADMVDPVGPAAGDERVIRGGSYRSGRAWLRGASRDKDIPSSRRAWRGFRCAYNTIKKRTHKPPS